MEGDGKGRGEINDVMEVGLGCGKFVILNLKNVPLLLKRSGKIERAWVI
jgi:hypothetical protein